MGHMKPFLIIAIALVSGLPLSAQTAIPSAGATPFRDTSMLKPPSGAKVAIIEFEDLECPLCAQVSPLVRGAMSRYHIPRVHHDFIIQSHVWSRTGAIYARYLEDKVSPQVAEDFRRDVFANQRLIASQDDLQQFARRWFPSHGQQMPFVIDPSGHCAAEVEADCKLGERLGVQHTPTIIVATAHQWIEVTEPNQLYAAIDRAESEASTSTLHARPGVHK
jgi:protein-disulfide isomerase